MKIIRDSFGTSVRLTDERLAHILEHTEMAGMEDELERVLQNPVCGKNDWENDREGIAIEHRVIIRKAHWGSAVVVKRFERSKAVEQLERLERASV